VLAPGPAAMPTLVYVRGAHGLPCAVSTCGWRVAGSRRAEGLRPWLAPGAALALLVRAGGLTTAGVSVRHQEGGGHPGATSTLTRCVWGRSTVGHKWSCCGPNIAQGKQLVGGGGALGDAQW
jgi:hypothetical protein